MFRTLPRFVVGALLGLSFLHASTATVAAQEAAPAPALFAQAQLAPGPFGGDVLFPVSAAPSAAETAVPSSAPDFSRLRRPALLPALYATNVALQVLDAHSTLRALGNGGREVNPVMKGVVGNRGALLAVKAGAAVGTIYFAEKLWKRNRVAAIALMVAVNGATAAIVAHNYKVSSNLR